MTEIINIKISKEERENTYFSSRYICSEKWPKEITVQKCSFPWLGLLGLLKKGYAHGVSMWWLYPSQYGTQPCKDGISCKYKVCFLPNIELLPINRTWLPITITSSCYFPFMVFSIMPFANIFLDLRWHQASDLTLQLPVPGLAQKHIFRSCSS